MTSAYDLPSTQTLGEGEHPACFGGNHMAARTFKEKKKNNSNENESFFHQILMSTLTWITGKE